jgi:hypothetical protein
MNQDPTPQVRILLVPDETVGADLLAFAQRLLSVPADDRGSGLWNGLRMENDARMRQSVAAADVVVLLLRASNRSLSGAVIAAFEHAREQGKPVHALVSPTTSRGRQTDEIQLKVDESHPIEPDQSWKGFEELRRWAADLSARFGHT